MIRRNFMQAIGAAVAGLMGGRSATIGSVTPTKRAQSPSWPSPAPEQVWANELGDILVIGHEPGMDTSMRCTLIADRTTAGKHKFLSGSVWPSGTYLLHFTDGYWGTDIRRHWYFLGYWRDLLRGIP